MPLSAQTDYRRTGTKRDEAVTMPQFGGVAIEDDVQIGALTVVAKRCNR